MNNKMVHRGPDDCGYYLDDNVGLAMRRLSIIDLEKGHQPIFNEDGSIAVVNNGEIYNYVELRAKLISNGHVFNTNSDTEVIVHLFEDKGADCVDELNGMFAFAIWDGNKKELFVFRDRIGIKPLYYRASSNSFVFSSDLSSIIAIKPGEKNVDFNAFLSYIGLSYISYPNTIFKGILKLEPGCYLKVTENGEVAKHKYWEVHEFETLEFSSMDEYSERLMELLDDAVRLQMRSDVSIGTFLSGGIDSSCIVALLSKWLNNPVKTFSVGFENGLNELPYAGLIAKRYKTDHTEIKISGNDVISILPEIIDKMDEPIADNSIIPTYMLSKIAIENGVKVILNGTGGDEIFGGYTRYLPQSQPWKTINSLPLILRKSFGNLFRFINFNKGVQIAVPELFFAASISGVNFALARNIFKDKDHCAMLINNVVKVYREFIPIIDQKLRKHQLMYLDLKDYLVCDVLSLLDKMSMAVSLEGRVPLLDHRLVEFCFKVPDRIKFKDGMLKGFLKHTLKDILPSTIMDLPKAGFAGPTNFWANNILKKSIEDHLINEPISFYKENLDLKELKRAIKYSGNNQNYSETLFSLYIFDLWYRKHIEGDDLVI